MEFESILYIRKPEETPRLAPVCFFDLNVDQIVETVGKFAGTYEVKELFYAFPRTEEEEAYRRGIYQDVKDPVVGAALTAFLDGMRAYAKAAANMRRLDNGLQRMAWHAASANLYCNAVRGLLDALDGAPALQSQGLLSLREFLRAYCGAPEFVRLFRQAKEIADRVGALRLILEIENNKIVVREGTLPGTYGQFLQTIEQTRDTWDSPFATALLMAPLESELAAVFDGKHPELFRAIEAFCGTFPSLCDERLLLLERELPYYLAFWKFEQDMQAAGFSFCVPQTDAEKNMEARGLYDLALAISNRRRGKPVVSNDFFYEKDERFFIVNGPNQGGKTTFARSLGQLVFFSKMGLDVPAVAANVHFFKKLLTHFSVEESMETGQGKLMEELNRLAPMMRESAKQSFVIINELFTTAAHYDGCVMGARVLTYFIGGGSRGIYVTHLHDLGDDLAGVVTMTATLSGGAKHRRTYKILRSEPEEVGYAEDIVKKYGLTYGQLQVRLKKASEPAAELSTEAANSVGVCLKKASEPAAELSTEAANSVIICDARENS